MRYWADPSSPAELGSPGSQGARPDRGGHSRGRGPDPRGVGRSPGRHEAQRCAGEAGPTAGRPRVDPPRRHLADRPPRRGSLPMSGVPTCGRTGVRKRHGGPMRTSALPRCAPEPARIRCRCRVLCRGGQTGRGRAGGTDRDGSDPRAPRAWFGRGAVRIFTRTPPPPAGVAPLEIIPAGRLFERRFEAVGPRSRSALRFSPVVDRLGSRVLGHSAPAHLINGSSAGVLPPPRDLLPARPRSLDRPIGLG